MAATVLVIEDDRSNRDLMSKVLCQDGHQILEACDGTIALKMLQTLRCDLVITDFLMPKLNGIKFIEQLHTVKPRMPIILITGYLSAVSGTPIVDKVADVLAKPFDLKVLRSAVRQLLHRTPHATP